MKKTSLLLFTFSVALGSISVSAANPFKMTRIVFDAVRSSGLSPISYKVSNSGQIYLVSTLENETCTVEVDNNAARVNSITCD